MVSVPLLNIKPSIRLTSWETCLWGSLSHDCPNRTDNIQSSNRLMTFFYQIQKMLEVFDLSFCILASFDDFFILLFIETNIFLALRFSLSRWNFIMEQSCQRLLIRWREEEGWELLYENFSSICNQTLFPMVLFVCDKCIFCRSLIYSGKKCYTFALWLYVILAVAYHNSKFI